MFLAISSDADKARAIWSAAVGLEEFRNSSVEIPVIPQPVGCNSPSSATRVNHVNIDSVIGAFVEDTMTWGDRGISPLVFKVDP